MKTEALLIYFIGVAMGTLLGFSIYRKDYGNGYNKGYKLGYNDSKLIYECDHDRAECEIIKDTL